MASAYFYLFQLCCSVSLGQWEDGFAAHREKLRRDKTNVRQVIGGPDQRESRDPGPPQHRPGSGSPEPHTASSAPELNKSEFNSEPKSLSWIIGNVNVEPKSSAPESVHGYQADFTGSTPAVFNFQMMDKRCIF